MSRFVVGATWDDAPHLSESAKADLLATIPPYQRDARAKGIPQLGSGAIYPIPLEDVLCDPFEIPPTWRHGFGMDVGWNRTAGVWGAEDPKTQITYLFSEYYRGEAEPSTHAQAWRARGLWIPGRIDPASRGRSQVDGQRLIDLYKAQGLQLQTAVNAVETGIYDVWMRLSSGRLKVFRTLMSWRKEYMLYVRDTKGHIVKQKDHLMDSTRYLYAGGTAWWAPRPVHWREPSLLDSWTAEPDTTSGGGTPSAQGWMA